MKGLYGKFALVFIALASGVLLIFTIAFLLETHYHFALYEHQKMDSGVNAPNFDLHFEQALVQSVLWSTALGVLFSIMIGLIVAKKITNPLIRMKRTAELMTKGELGARTAIKGNDELSELGASLNHLAEQLQSQEQLRKMLTADIAHELRTPIAIIKSHMEAMIEGVWELTPERLEGCYEEIERLRFLVGDLEQLTEMEAPHFMLTLQEENVSAIVKRHVEASRSSFEKKGIELTFLSETEQVHCKVDKFRFGQIVDNLLTNALKFTPQGGLVAVEIKKESHHLVMLIIDTGMGIAEEELPLVFERFYRTDKSRDRKAGGSGIGLTIVRKLVEAHSGTIHLTSAVGEGTTVAVRLPLL